MGLEIIPMAGSLCIHMGLHVGELEFLNSWKTVPHSLETRQDDALSHRPR